MVKDNLNIKSIISVRFSDIKSEKFEKYNDTVCTSLARCFKKNICTYIDRKKGQLCPGGDYFLHITHTPKDEVCNVYVTDEKVFKNNSVCNTFIKSLPKYPTVARKRYILFTPLKKETDKPDVIMLLVNPAQASRILGLNVYKKMSLPLVVPALSTCASIYAPIESNTIHLNFIDYYDRYFQGVENKKLLWKNHHMIISMPFNIFEEMLSFIPLSAHGNFKPKIKPQKFDCI